MQKTVFKGHRSPFYVPVLNIFGQAYAAAAMAGISRVYLKYIPADDADAEYADSDAHLTAFDWATYADKGYLVVDVGLLDLTVGRDLAAEVVVYDATYTEGRVIAQLDMEVVADALGDIALADALSIIAPNAITVLNITEPTTLTTADLLKTVCAVSADDIPLQLPAVGADADGYYIDLVVGGAGSVIATAADADTIGDALKTVLTVSGDGGTFAHVRIMYLHAITAWVVFRMGRISGS